MQVHDLMEPVPTIRFLAKQVCPCCHAVKDVYSVRIKGNVYFACEDDIEQSLKIILIKSKR
jgi:hypothetical protein